MRIHFTGSGGVSVSALMRLAAHRGHTVSGSDSALSGHDPKNVCGCDLVVYSSAVPENNVELVAAKRLGIPTMERAAYLGAVASEYETVVSVAGCHGKSTTVAMLAAAAKPLNPTVHVGVAAASVIGGDKLFVTEACEYRESFLFLRSDIGVILNVGYDHPDYYESEADVAAAYEKFAKRSKTALVCGDDETASGIAHKKSFGQKRGNDYMITDIVDRGGKRSFTIKTKRGSTRLDLSVYGMHNVYNAAAAFAVCDMLGIQKGEAKSGIESFSSLPRRFEYKGEAFGKRIYTDYAHHPDEISATVAAAHEIYKTVAVVFQPHTYSRTKALLREFAAALKAADTSIITPIYAAREIPDGTDPNDLKKAITALGGESFYCETNEEILELCKDLEEQAVIFMGAGNIDKLADAFVGSRLHD